MSFKHLINSFHTLIQRDVSLNNAKCKEKQVSNNTKTPGIKTIVACLKSHISQKIKFHKSIQIFLLTETNRL